jgi:hypothetical protein
MQDVRERRESFILAETVPLLHNIASRLLLNQTTLYVKIALGTDWSKALFIGIRKL